MRVLVQPGQARPGTGATSTRRAVEPSFVGAQHGPSGPLLRRPLAIIRTESALDWGRLMVWISCLRRIRHVDARSRTPSPISLIRTAALASAGAATASHARPGFPRAGGCIPPSPCHHCGACSALCTYAGPLRRTRLEPEHGPVHVHVRINSGTLALPESGQRVAMPPRNNATSTAVPFRQGKRRD